MDEREKLRSEIFSLQKQSNVLSDKLREQQLKTLLDFMNKQASDPDTHLSIRLVVSDCSDAFLALGGPVCEADLGEPDQRLCEAIILFVKNELSMF